MKKISIIILLSIIFINVNSINKKNNNNEIWKTVTNNNKMVREDDVFIKQNNIKTKFDRKTGLVERNISFNLLSFNWFWVKPKIKVKNIKKTVIKQIDSPR